MTGQVFLRDIGDGEEEYTLLWKKVMYRCT